MTAKENAYGSTRSMVRAPTVTLDELEMHVTTLNPGQTSHAPHQHANEELIILREGTLETLSLGQWKRVGPGSIIFNASNDLHGVKNVGHGARGVPRRQLEVDDDAGEVEPDCNPPRVGVARSPASSAIQPWLAVALAKPAILDPRRPLWLSDAVSSSCSCSSSWRSPSRPSGWSSWACGGGAGTAGLGQLDAGARGRRRPPGNRAGRRHRPVLRGAADGALARRRAAQGQGRSARHERHHPADRHRRALGQGAGGPRRDRRLQALEEADRRLPRVRRRAGVLPRERLRQGLPDADGVARPDRHGELRAVPARHARQDRRVPGRAPHRRLQDGVEHLHRAHLHAGAPRDGRVAQHRSLRAARRRPRRRAGTGRRRDPRPHRPRPVPARGRRPRRARRRPGLRGRDRRQGGRSGAAAPTRCASRTTAASRLPRSASTAGRGSR